MSPTQKLKSKISE